MQPHRHFLGDSKIPAMGYLACFIIAFLRQETRLRGAGATRSHKREADVHHSASTRGTPGQQSAELPCDWGTGEGGLAQGPPITWGLEVPPQAPRKPGHHQRAQPLPRENVFLARRQEHVKHTLMPSGLFSLLNLCFCVLSGCMGGSGLKTKV